MAVIKNQLAPNYLRDAIVLDMGDLRRQADRLREAAQQQADQIIADAQAKAALVAKQSRADAEKAGHDQGLLKGTEEGLKKGHAEALARSDAQLKQIQNAWLEAAAGWSAQREQAERDARQTILRLGLIFAEKVVQRVVQVDSEVIVDQLAEAICYVLRPTDVTVRINPADRAAVDEAMPQLLKGLAHLEHVEVAEDDTITRGGCMVAYGQGRIDATVDTQMRRLVELIIPDGNAPTDDVDEPPLPLTPAS
ncbi:MAG: FliH/SctL family protein [Phycisphaeraceae bacterium]